MFSKGPLVVLQFRAEGNDGGGEPPCFGPCDGGGRTVALSCPPALDRRDLSSGQRGAPRFPSRVRSRAVSALRAPVRAIERRAARRIRSASLRPSALGLTSSVVAVPRTVRAAATASIASDLPWARRDCRRGGLASQTAKRSTSSRRVSLAP